MNKLEKYQIEDFVQDLYFRKWVLKKLSSKDCFWENWLEQHPNKKMLLEEAKSLVIASQIEEKTIPTQQIQQGIQAILNRTESKQQRLFEQTWFKIAASIVLIMAFTFLYQKSFFSVPNGEYLVLSKTTETENNSLQPLSTKLSDGSVVTLKKGSKLQVSTDFGVQTRTVFLTGEAFFEVQKDPQRPFIVYAGGIVTKVLGTSFTIRAYKDETKTLVAVRTGRVTVYQQAGTNDIEHLGQMLLVPNQQVVFEKTEEKLVKTLVEKPILLFPNSENSQFEYDETPISKVLTQIEEAYGVKITFDADLLAHCNLTAVFQNQETLYEKIEVICETIQARYEVVDGQIVIYAKGCK
ncbi:FecR family protein [Runella sp.]|jgi:ferric-dicitrate binding protein FerR (iron transport regulator)|uniref:FecR family protein n=1 Tax=Runella sp. TaxID=1960881 RepID=UPI002612CAAE|nr:FecR family protein [Runella sp.]